MPIAKSGECEIADFSWPGDSHWPDLAELKMASITAMFSYGVFERDGNLGAIDNRFGEGIALQRVLIADGEGFVW